MCSTSWLFHLPLGPNVRDLTVAFNTGVAARSRWHVVWQASFSFTCPSPAGPSPLATSDPFLVEKQDDNQYLITADSAPRVLIFVDDIRGQGKLMIITQSPSKDEQRRDDDSTQRSSEQARASYVIVTEKNNRKGVKVKKTKKGIKISTHIHTTSSVHTTSSNLQRSYLPDMLQRPLELASSTIWSKSNDQKTSFPSLLEHPFSQ